MNKYNNQTEESIEFIYDSIIYQLKQINQDIEKILGEPNDFYKL